MRARSPSAQTLWLVICLGWCIGGCTDGHPVSPHRHVPTPEADAAPKVAKVRKNFRKKIKLPPPQSPPPRLAGEVKTPDDFQALRVGATGDQPGKPGAPPIQRLDAYKLRVGKVFIDRQRRVVEVPSQVNMTDGILEYYTVASGGKLHESVLESFIEPSHLHLALILMGLEPSVWDRSNREVMPKLIKQGADLILKVRWTDPATGKQRVERAEHFLYSRQAKGSPKPRLWSFHGSLFWEQRYSADMDRSIVGLIPDDTVVVKTKAELGNPYQGENLGFEINKKNIPPKGTKVTLIFEAAGPVKPPQPAPDRPAKP